MSTDERPVTIPSNVIAAVASVVAVGLRRSRTADALIPTERTEQQTAKK